MKLLFWNLNRNSIEEYVVDLIKENSIDIAVFTEYKSTDFSYIIENLNEEYERAFEVREDAKITLCHRKKYKVRVEEEKTNYTIYSIGTSTKKFIISGVHLPAKPWADEGSRNVITRKILTKIKDLESELNHDNTIVIGDFNANPFDEELIQKDAFNAVLF